MSPRDDGGEIRIDITDFKKETEDGDNQDFPFRPATPPQIGPFFIPPRQEEPIARLVAAEELLERVIRTLEGREIWEGPLDDEEGVLTITTT